MATNFNDTLPVAAAGKTNVNFATDGSGNISASVDIATYAVDSGAANAYVISGVPTPIVGTCYRILMANANTTASTLVVDGAAAAPITKNGTTALAGAEIGIGAIVTVVFDGTNYQLQGKY